MADDLDSAELHGDVAIVTGAAAGIGRATAQLLAAHGASIALVDLDAERGAQAAGELHTADRPCLVFACDLRHQDEIAATVANVTSRLGQPRILVNCAGIVGSRAPTTEMSEHNWDLVQTVNVKATWLMSRAVVPGMIAAASNGRIINISSASAFRATTVSVAYAASKAALTGMTRALAGELAPHDINVNAVAPGITDTGIHGDDSGEAKRERARSGPTSNLFGRVSTATDVAETITFLCLPASRQITGQTIHVSAGAIT